MRPSIRSIRVVAPFVAVLLLCTTGAVVHAWGAKGHRIAGHMAHDLLTPETGVAIQQLMGSDDLATFSLYLDQRKDQLDRVWVPKTHRNRQPADWCTCRHAARRS
jgi:hypothetical protein